MKRVLVLVGVGAVVLAVVLDNVLFKPAVPPADNGIVSCPIYFTGTIGDVIPKDDAASRWQVYRYDGEKGTAEVNASASASTIPTPSRPHSCQLTIVRAPETPGKASDWRIGHVVKPDGFRGKTVRYRVAIKADRKIKLDTGQIYLYDGVKVLGAWTPLLTPEWTIFEATMNVDPAATTFEVWLRLLLDKGTIQPGSGSVYFVPEVEIQGG